MEDTPDADDVEEVPALTQESLRHAETLTQPQRHQHIQLWASSVDATCTDDSHGHETGSQPQTVTSPTSQTATTATTANTTPEQHISAKNRRSGPHKAPRQPGHQNGDAREKMEAAPAHAGQPMYRSRHHKHTRHASPGGKLQPVHVRVFAPRVLESHNLTYTIEMETQNPAFKHSRCRVDRRYSHCRWLRQCLGTKTPFPSPISRPNLESLQEHDRQLQGIKHFLARVANVAQYQQRRALQDFFNPDVGIDQWDWVTDLAAPLPPAAAAATRNDAGAGRSRSNRLSSTSTLESAEPVPPHVFSPTSSTPSKQRHRSPAKASAPHDDTSTDGSHRTVYDNYMHATSASSSRVGDVSTEDVYHSEGGRAMEKRPHNRHRRHYRSRRRHHHHRHQEHHTRSDEPQQEGDEEEDQQRRRQQKQQQEDTTPPTFTPARGATALHGNGQGDGGGFVFSDSLGTAPAKYYHHHHHRHHHHQQQHRHANGRHQHRHEDGNAYTTAAARVVRPATPPLEQPVIEDQELTPHRRSRAHPRNGGGAGGVGGTSHRGEKKKRARQPEEQCAGHTRRGVQRGPSPAAVADVPRDATDHGANNGNGDYANFNERPPRLAQGDEHGASEQRLPPRHRVVQWWIPLDGAEMDDGRPCTAHQEQQWARQSQKQHHGSRRKDRPSQPLSSRTHAEEHGRSGTTWTIPFTPQSGSFPQRKQHRSRPHHRTQQQEQVQMQEQRVAGFEHCEQLRERGRGPFAQRVDGAGHGDTHPHPHRQETHTTDPLRFTAFRSPQRQTQKHEGGTAHEHPVRSLQDSVQWLQLDASHIDSTLRP